MSTRRELKSVAHALAGSFISRYNDLEGYWGLGVLCAAGIAPQKPQWQNVPVGPLSDWHQMHLRGDKVLVLDRETLDRKSVV